MRRFLLDFDINQTTVVGSLRYNVRNRWSSFYLKRKLVFDNEILITCHLPANDYQQQDHLSENTQGEVPRGQL